MAGGRRRAGRAGRFRRGPALSVALALAALLGGGGSSSDHRRADPGPGIGAAPDPGFEAMAVALRAGGDPLEVWLWQAIATFRDRPRVPIPGDAELHPARWIGAERRLAARLAGAGADLHRELAARLLDPAGPVGPRCLLVRLLRQAGVGGTAGRLRTLLRREPGGPVAWEAAICLARHRDRDAAPDLVAMVDATRGWGRQYPIVALGLLDEGSGRGAVLAALEDSEPAVVRHAAAYLVRFEDAELDRRLEALARTHDDPVTRGVVYHHLQRRSAPRS